MKTDPIIVKKRLARILAWAIVFLLWLAATRATLHNPLLNFSVVDPGRLMRSGQPYAQDYEEIKSTKGLGTIVNLRGSIRAAEREWAEANGVKVIAMRMWADIPPKSSQVGVFFAVMRGEPINVAANDDIIVEHAGLGGEETVTFPFPVLLHCEGGSDRTGVLTALYRVAFMGWSMDDAKLEAMLNWHIPPSHPDQFKYLDGVKGPIGPSFGDEPRKTKESAKEEIKGPSPSPLD